MLPIDSEKPELAWFVVHPAFSRPVPVESVGWYGVTEAHLREWTTTRTEEQEDQEISDSWTQVADWAANQGLDRIVVDDVDPVLTEDVIELGYQPAHTRSRHRWKLTPTSPVELATILKATHAIPRINLTVLAGEVERIRVRDWSWDSVYVALDTNRLRG